MADIVNGFVSPGYAVSNQLQEILARKAAERHQAILEEIQRQNADTNRMQAESYEKEREAHAKQYEAEANRKRLDDFSRGQDISDDTYDWMKNAGYGDLTTQTPSGELEGGTDEMTDVGPHQVMKRTYLGSPTEQKEARQTDALAKLMQTPEFAESDPLRQLVMLRQAGITNVNPEQLRKSQSVGHVWVLDEATGKVSMQTGPDGKPIEVPQDHFMTRNRAPLGPGGGADSFSYLTTEGEDGAPPQLLALSRKGAPPRLVPLPDGIKPGPRAGNNPPAAGSAKQTIDESQLAGLASIRMSRAKAKNPTPEQKDQWARAEATAMATIVANYAAGDTKLANFVNSIITAKGDAGAKFRAQPIPKIVADIEAATAAKAGQTLSEQDKQHLYTLLPAVLGHQ